MEIKFKMMENETIKNTAKRFNLNKTRFVLLLVMVMAFGGFLTTHGQTLDAFNPNASSAVADIEVLADGKLLVCGIFSSIGGQNRGVIARLNADGTADTTFSNVNVVPTSISEMVVQPDGKILVSGDFNEINGTARRGVARLNADGTLDSSFNAGFTATSFSIGRIGLQADGKVIVLAGVVGVGTWTILRLNADGTNDSSFGSRTFGGLISRVAIQPDGKIIAVGEFTTVDGNSRQAVVRLNTNGTVDNSFNANANNSTYNITLAPDGKIYVGGFFTSIGGQARSLFARLNADGSADTGFQPPPFTGTGNLEVRPSVVLPSGKVLVSGIFETVGGSPRKSLVRLNSNGTLDTTFRDMQVIGSNSNTSPLAMKLDTSGKIVIGGTFISVDGQTRNRMARISFTDSSPVNKPFDFDGDNKADLGVFRPSNGGWYIYNLANNSNSSYAFGQVGDVITPADYDGDGKTDIAVYRAGVWYLLRSQLGFTGIAFGAASDIPAPADFDGDGKAELAVFRPSTGSWFTYNLANGASSGINFGQNGDAPVPADYDSDGKADFAVYRNGAWYLLRSTLGFTGVSFGDVNDKTVPADYDGDGKADIAVFRPSNGGWYILQSNAGFASYIFGQNGDAPVPADYDGDGKADIAVFRQGSWYLQRSTAGFTGVAFGATTDLAVPNAYVR